MVLRNRQQNRALLADGVDEEPNGSLASWLGNCSAMTGRWSSMKTALANFVCIFSGPGQVFSTLVTLFG